MFTGPVGANTKLWESGVRGPLSAAASGETVLLEYPISFIVNRNRGIIQLVLMKTAASGILS